MVRSILEFLAHPVGLGWQFVGLANHDKGLAQVLGEGQAKEKPTRLNPGDCSEVLGRGERGHLAYRFVSSLGVGEERGDIAKADPRLGKVLNDRNVVQ